MHSDKLAVIFPGMGYNADKPLLYYTKKLARKAGYDVIDVTYELPVKCFDAVDIHLKKLVSLAEELVFVDLNSMADGGSHLSVSCFFLTG